MEVSVHHPELEPRFSTNSEYVALSSEISYYAV